MADRQVLVSQRAILDLIEVARIAASEIRQAHSAPSLADALSGATAAVEAEVLCPA